MPEASERRERREIQSWGTPSTSPSDLPPSGAREIETASSAPVRIVAIDGSGGTSVGHVFIRAKSAGLYRGAVSSPAQPESGDPGTDAGTLTLRVHGNRTAVGRLELLGKTYRFTAPINEVNKFGAVLASNPRLGTSLGIQVWMRSNGSTWSLEATIIKNGLPFSATCTPVE